MDEIGFENSSGNVFADIGFSPTEAEELTAKSALILAVKDIMRSGRLRRRKPRGFVGRVSRRSRRCCMGGWKASLLTVWPSG